MVYAINWLMCIILRNAEKRYKLDAQLGHRTDLAWDAFILYGTYEHDSADNNLWEFEIVGNFIARTARVCK